MYHKSVYALFVPTSHGTFHTRPIVWRQCGAGCVDTLTQNNCDQTHSCLRDSCLSASWRAPLKSPYTSRVNARDL